MGDRTSSLAASCLVWPLDDSNGRVPCLPPALDATAAPLAPHADGSSGEGGGGGGSRMRWVRLASANRELRRGASRERITKHKGERRKRKARATSLSTQALISVAAAPRSTSKHQGILAQIAPATWLALPFRPDLSAMWGRWSLLASPSRSLLLMGVPASGSRAWAGCGLWAVALWAE